jgi:hypothetical protein
MVFTYYDNHGFSCACALKLSRSPHTLYCRKTSLESWKSISQKRITKQEVALKGACVANSKSRAAMRYADRREGAQEDDDADHDRRHAGELPHRHRHAGHQGREDAVTPIANGASVRKSACVIGVRFPGLTQGRGKSLLFRKPVPERNFPWTTSVSVMPFSWRFFFTPR